MTTIITPPPSTVTHSNTPAGQKSTRTSDLKTEIAKTAVPKDLRVDHGEEKSRKDLPETHRRTSPDGTARLVTLNEKGVKVETPIAPSHSEKLQLLTTPEKYLKFDQTV